MSNYKEKLHKITTLVFDYDGVLTNGSVFISEDGLEFRRSNVKDGYALQYAHKKGLRTVIISGSHDKGIIARGEKLNIDNILIGISDKKQCFSKLLSDHNIKKEEVLFMGDDIPDYPLMTLSGVACCPADAANEIKNTADYISEQKGGEGCVRDIIEQVMKVKGLWFNKDAFHW